MKKMNDTDSEEERAALRKKYDEFQDKLKDEIDGMAAEGTI